MFEREIKFIYDFNLNKVNKLGPYFTFEQLAGTDINPAILHYISAEINYLIFEDRQKLLKNSIFDYSNDVIAYHFSQISDEVKKTKRFALEYIGKLILHASSFTINYLARPKWTLAKFIFDEGDHKTTFEIKQILEYVYYYPYLKKILISYINKKKIISMNSDEFVELLNKVDRLGMDSYLPSILNNSLKSMSEFFNIGEVQKSRVPLSAVELFLDEKQLYDHMRTLKKALGEDSNAKYDIQDYLRVFRNVVHEKPEIIEEEESEYSNETLSGSDGIPDDENRSEFTPDERFESTQEELIQEIETKHKKLRIRIDQDNKIEPVEEEEIGETELAEESPGEAQAEEDGDDFSDIFIKDEEVPEKEETAEISGPNFEEPEETEEQETEKDEAEFTEGESEESDSEPVAESFEELAGETEDQELTEVIPETGDDAGISSSLIESESVDKEIIPEEIALPSEENLPEKNEEGKLVFTDESWDDDIEETIGDIQEDDDAEIEIKGIVKSEEEKEITGADEEDDIDTFTNILNPPAEEIEDESESEEVEVSYHKTPAAPQSQAENGGPKIEIADLLEHKDTTRIIEVIYDYDIEEFASTIDSISNCGTLEDALLVLNQTLKNHHIDRNSREAESFRAIISEYFNRK